MIAKKRNIIALSVLNVVGALGIVCAIPFAMNSFNPSKADEIENAIIFNSGKNHITSKGSTETSSTIISEKGNTFTIKSSGIFAAEDKWQEVEANGYFYTTSDESTDKNAIHDMKTIIFNFVTPDQPFTIYFSRDGSFETRKCWSRSYTTKTDGQTIYFEGHPRYFKFAAGTTAISIKNMKIEYGCDASADIIWDNDHGINPVFTYDTEQKPISVTYGLYPQKHVSNQEQGLIDAGSDKGEEEYFWYNDEYYVKDKTVLYKPDYIVTFNYLFSDGDIAYDNIICYFKCEPIKWNIIQWTNTNYTIDCSNVLYAHRFNPPSIEGGTNDYANSELETWLNGDFYNKAFFFNPSLILPTNLADVSVTGDKVWVGSKTEYNSWYSSEKSREKNESDYALCNGAFKIADLAIGNGMYWTRTAEYPSTFFYQSYVVDNDGSIGKCQALSTFIGISPCLTIKK